MATPAQVAKLVVSGLNYDEAIKMTKEEAADELKFRKLKKKLRETYGDRDRESLQQMRDK